MSADPRLQGVSPVDHLCALARLSRAGFYRRDAARPAAKDDADLRSAIHAIALDNRAYGHRMVTAVLRRQGFVVNRKRVLRLMREDNLLAMRKAAFAPRTTDSAHPFPIVPNLVRGLAPTAPDQIWVADITYIRLAGSFVFLAAVLDAFSRKAIGWALADHLRAALCIEALDMALAARKPPPESLIHHSDRGVQYACEAYAARLDAGRVAASMSRPGNPYDNAKAERFMRTLKDEEVRMTDYATIDEARASIGRFLDDTYNTRRLHSALGYLTPVEFEQNFRDTSKQANH
jgi:putative transposase